MPTPALATTKRKFHKLLDSISSAASSPLPSSTTTTTNTTNNSTTTLPSQPSKRARLDFTRPRSSYIPPSQRTIISRSSPTRPSSVIVLPPTAPRVNGVGEKFEREGKEGKEGRGKPNFAPWDREQFLQRLKTFRFVDKWAAKPEGVGEVEWAKRGWSCVGRERVRCLGGCEGEVVVSLEGAVRGGREEGDVGEGKGEDGEDEGREGEEDEETWREDAQKVLVEKYAEMMATAHEGSCLWRRRGLPVINPTIALEGLRTRYQSLIKMAAELPEMMSTPDSLDLAKLGEWCRPAVLPSSNTNATAVDGAAAEAEQVNTSALTLALCGWQAEEDGHISGLATCTACFRRLGLWLFKGPADGGGGEGDVGREASMARLDVVDEHRDYCPWVNAISQNGGGRRTSLDSLAGWEILVRAVRNSAKRWREEASERESERGEARAGVNGVGREESGDVDGASVMSQGVSVEEEKKRDEERWARLKRLKQVFNVKGMKKRGAEQSVVRSAG
ncbi:uncharacterized protein KY384_002794 [Bacidia gigantensis]|uniref:uncharacterized protein n=1 Tax=Bacidia gigantensis TaxID=2732470 RepID=UPI001D05A4C8|nr:uncharacterized protein KY384_002794 [Bacidia gigantensis]KAG8532916.1 hypothetical protein KY384_002794 [Bacidia gigantensis]